MPIALTLHPCPCALALPAARLPALPPNPTTGEAGGPGSLIKYNPLSNMSSAETWNFLRVMGVPTNKLHACGYDSIGCEPCTRPVLPNQHEREGRWWWEDSTGKHSRWWCCWTRRCPVLCSHWGPPAASAHTFP